VGVKPRIVALVAVVLVWVSLWFVAGSNSATSEAARLWLQENRYLEQENILRMGVGPDISGQGVAEVHRNPDRVRVAVFGDSYAYGAGAADLDMRWPVRLQDALDALAGVGVFEVVSYARNGASLTSYAQAAATRGAEFDVLVVGYVWNDVFVSPQDEVEVPCFDGPAVGSPARVCRVLQSSGTPEDISKVLAPTSPVRPLFIAAADSLFTAAAGRPLLVARTVTGLREFDATHPAVELLAAAGMEVIDMVSTRQLLTDPTAGVLAVNPGDHHPGSALTRRYAADVAPAVLAAVDPARLRAARRGAVAPERRLVSNVLPSSLLVTELTSDRALVRSVTASGLFRPGRQLAPCAELVRPHARVMLDRTLPTGTRVAVTLRSGPPVELWTVGFDVDGYPVDAAVGELAVGATFEVTLEADLVRGILVAPPGSGCPARRTLTLPVFEVEIEILRP
jgi:hypothetical protein